MLSLADTTDLLDQTTTRLMNDPDFITPQQGVVLIDSWLGPLQEAENTQPLAEQLAKLKVLLMADSIDEQAICDAVSPLSEQLSLFSSQLAGEGEMPALLEGLSVALRQAAGGSKADMGA